MFSPDSFTNLLDELCRADLESFRDWYATCIFWSTAAVVIGCVMEIPEVIHGLWDDLFPVRFVRPVKVVSSIGLLFVALGVTGELVFDHWRSGYEGLLQRFENVLLVDAEQHAAAAQQKANEAALEAGYLGVKVDKLPSFVTEKEGEINGDIARFQTYANRIQQQSVDATNRLQADTAALDKASEDAKTAAKQAEIELAAVEVANRPRYLSPPQQADFVMQMKNFGKLSAQIIVPPSTTPDAGPLSDLLTSLLKDGAGWKADEMHPGGGWAKYVLVCIGKSPKPNVEAAATAMVLALRAANIQAFINTEQDPKAPVYGMGTVIPNPDMAIYVGSKI